MMHPTQSKHLAIVGNHWFPDKAGGLDRYVYEVAQHLSQKDISIDLFGLDMPEQQSMMNLSLISLASAQQSTLQRLWSSHQVFRAQELKKFDAINLHFALNSLPLLSHLPSEVPKVFTFHGPWFQESQEEGEKRVSVALKKILERIVYQQCHYFIVLSQAFGEILHQEFAIPWESITVIPGGVNLNRFNFTMTRQQARTQLGWPQDRFIIFTPRRLVQRMGLSQLMTAISALEKKQEVWVAIAGKGPLRSQLENQTIEMALQNQIKLLGFLPDDDLPIAYQAADLTVMPSQSLEGFGLVLLESLACGTPALCTPVGGMPEVLQNFSPELVAESETAEGLRYSLENILRGETHLPTRTSCRLYVAENFNWSTIADRVREVIFN